MIKRNGHTLQFISRLRLNENFLGTPLSSISFIVVTIFLIGCIMTRDNHLPPKSDSKMDTSEQKSKLIAKYLCGFQNQSRARQSQAFQRLDY